MISIFNIIIIITSKYIHLFNEHRAISKDKNDKIYLVIVISSQFSN